MHGAPHLLLGTQPFLCHVPYEQAIGFWKEREKSLLVSQQIVHNAWWSEGGGASAGGDADASYRPGTQLSLPLCLAEGYLGHTFCSQKVRGLK